MLKVNFRVSLLIISLFLAFLAVHPTLDNGVAIRGIDKGSASEFAGINAPSQNTRPTEYERIISLDGKKVDSLSQYNEMIKELNGTFGIRTDRSSYLVDLENISLGLHVSEVSKTNIRKGLDLQGGIRVLLQPKEKVEKDVLERVKQSLEQRLNAFGLNDVVIRTTGDLSGNDYVLVEIAGLQQSDVEDIVASQGKFEAKILNKTAFTGGEDITYVCRSADCSGIDTRQGCQDSGSGVSCRFFFTITLTPNAAQSQADLTKNLDVVSNGGGSYLSEPIQLFLDDELVNELNIGPSLRGKAETTIQISGSGEGLTRALAVENALVEMNHLQAVMETGSLPVEMEIVKIDTLSPTLGVEFLKNAILMGVFALLGVAIVIFARYKTIKVVAPVIFMNISEVVLLLGVSAVLGTNLDLAAIAGIIIVVGTGVDHQIVILDELRRGKRMKDGLKAAFFVIFAAFFTTGVAMIPLWFAGAGILKGFATTTIYGLLIGVLITRPAFAAMVKKD